MNALSPDLRPLLQPRSIAVIGASTQSFKVGGMPIRLLHENGYAGRVYPVHRTAAEIQGLKAYASLQAIGEPVDLAIIAVPVEACADAMEQIVSTGTRSAVVFTSGFAETGEFGERAQLALAEQARAHGVVLLGPNCLGAMNLHERVFATFSPVALGGTLAAGNMALVSQSGAFGGYAYSLARDRGLGLGYWITTGNEAGIQVADAIEWLVGRDECDVILAYMEGARDGGRLRSALAAARAASKPVAIVKVGHSRTGARAARLHTGSDTGEAGRYRELFDEYGVHQANSIDGLFRVAYSLARGRPPREWKSEDSRSHAASVPVALLTISGGVGIMMADRAEEMGLRMPPLPDLPARRLLDAVPYAATSNPIDVTGQVLSQPTVLVKALDDTARSQCYGYVIAFLGAGLRAPGVWPLLQDALAALQCDRTAAPVVLSGICTAEQRNWLEMHGCLVFAEPADAVDAVVTLAREAAGAQKSR